MDRERFDDQQQRDEWETPAAERIGVSAEACAYMGIWQDWV